MKTSNDLRCVALDQYIGLFLYTKRGQCIGLVLHLSRQNSWKSSHKFGWQNWVTAKIYNWGGGLCRLRASTLTTPVSGVSCHVAWATFVVRVHAVKHWVWQGLWCADPFFCQSKLVFMSSLRIRKILVTTSHSRWSSAVGCYPCKFHSCLAT